MTTVIAWLWQTLGGLKEISKLEEEIEHFKHENGTEEILRHLYASPFSKRADLY